MSAIAVGVGGRRHARSCARSMSRPLLAQHPQIWAGARALRSLPLPQSLPPQLPRPPLSSPRRCDVRARAEAARALPHAESAAPSRAVADSRSAVPRRRPACDPPLSLSTLYSLSAHTAPPFRPSVSCRRFKRGDAAAPPPRRRPRCPCARAPPSASSSAAAMPPLLPSPPCSASPGRCPTAPLPRHPPPAAMPPRRRRPMTRRARMRRSPPLPCRRRRRDAPL